MKRIALFALAFAMVLSFFGCNGSKISVENNVDSSAYDTTLATNEATTVPDEEQDMHVSLSQKLIDEIDGAYREEVKNGEVSSNVGKVDLTSKYTEKWKQTADEYYGKLMEYEGIVPPSDIYYSSDDLHTFVSDMKNTWETYSKEQRKNYLKVLQTVYAAGTIVGPLIAEYEYDMQMEWTLELVEICEQLGIE